MEKTGEAGRRGDGVRSDCWVQVTLKDSGGLQVKIESKVESMYGASIRRLVHEVLEQLGLGNAEILLEDFGAWPFVIAARLECAARRADKDLKGTYLPPLNPACTYGT